MSKPSLDHELADMLDNHWNVYQEYHGKLWVIHPTECLPRATVELDRQLQCQLANAHEHAQHSLTAHDHSENLRLEPPSGSAQGTQILGDLLTRKRKLLFITGEGGAGKTEFTRHLAWALSPPLGARNPESRVPIWVALNELSSFQEPLLDRLVSGTSLKNSPSLTKLVDGGRLIFILDGLDELNANCNRNVFEADLTGLIQNRCRGCSFVLAGRPGSLGRLAPLVSPENQFELDPLSSRDIDQYVTKYFGHYQIPARGRQFMEAILQSDSLLRSALRQPFMLAFACRLFLTSPEGTPLPHDSFGLLDAGLRRLFERRRYDRHRNPSGSLRVDCETCLDSLGILSAYSIDSRYAIDGVRAIDLLCQHAGITPQEAEDRLAQLAPGAGVLVRTALGGYRITNRLIAEFLAARWIAQHGLIQLAAETDVGPDNSLARLYSHYVWSDDHRNLLRWLCFALARRSDRVALLTRVGQWLSSHLQDSAQENGENWRDDWHRSLLYRFLDLLSAVRPHTPAWHGTTRARLAQNFVRVLPPQGNWFWCFNDDGLAEIASDLRGQHRDALVAKLSEDQKDDFRRKAMRVLANSWAGDEDMGEVLRVMMIDEKNTELACDVADELAHGWAKDEEIGASLRVRLRKEKNTHYFARFAKAHGQGWAADQEAGDLIRSRLEITKDDYVIAMLAQALGRGWATDEKARDSLRKTLKRVKGSYSSRSIVEVLVNGGTNDEQTCKSLLRALRTSEWDTGIAAGALLRGWPEHRNTVGRILRTRVRHDDNEFAVGECAQILAEAWPRDEKAGKAIRSRLYSERGRSGICGVPAALVIGWARDEEMGKALHAKLVSETDAGAITILAAALAYGWAGDEYMGKELRTMLADECNADAILGLATALARSWPSYKQEAGKALRAMLASEKDRDRIKHIAGALAGIWAGDKEMGEALLSKLDCAQDQIVGGYLAEMLVKGWNDNHQVLQRLIAMRPQSMSRLLGPDWIVLSAPNNAPNGGLIAWAGRCDWKETVGEAYHLVSLSGTTGTAQSHALRTRSKYPPTDRTFLLAPREELRPGLDPMLDPSGAQSAIAPHIGSPLSTVKQVGRIVRIESEPFIPNANQRAILKALNGRALRTEGLASETKIERRTLFIASCLGELKQQGLVKNHKRVGYYRPDCPPPEVRDANVSRDGTDDRN